MKSGDIGFAHSKGWMAKLIRLGEWMRFRKGCYFNHMFVLDRYEDGKWYVIQATLRGVTDTMELLDDQMGQILVVDCPLGVNRKKVVEFARAQVGVRYGIGTILAIAIDIVTWDWVPSFRGARKNSWICSALAMESLRMGGYYHECVDIYTITPAEGFIALHP